MKLTDRMPLGGLLQMTTAMAVSGSIGWFVIVSGQHVAQIVLWRCIFGTAVLLPVCIGLRSFRALAPRALAIAVLGGAAMVANWLLLFAAFSSASISVVTAAYHMQPFLLVVLGATFLGERLTAAKMAWLALAFGGLLLILEVGSVGVAPGTNAAGIALALGAACCWAVAALTAKLLSDTPPQLIALIHVAVGAVVLAPSASFTPLPQGGQAWSTLLVIGLVHTGFVYVLMYNAIQKLPTLVQGALSYLNPVVAFAIDALVFGQQLHTRQLWGIGAVLMAVGGINGLWPRRARCRRVCTQ